MTILFQSVSEQLGIPIWIFIIVLLWSGVWKLLAMWKSARNNSIIWFIIFALTNTLGILPILYIFGFSKMKTCKLERKSVKKKTVRKKVTKKK